MIKNYLPLVHAIIDAVLFLESSGSDQVNPDSAVQCMENIASSLLRLEKSDQIALRTHFEEIAEKARDQAYKNFVLAMPDSIGLASS